MPPDFVLTSHLDAPQPAQLHRAAMQLDGRLEHPSGTPQPVQPGQLEQQ